MQIEHIHIRNLRSIGEMHVDLSSVTALLGGNNVGKSTVLKAIEIFFEASPKFTDDDLFNRSVSEIQVTIRFKDLTNSELDEFGSAVRSDKIEIRRIISKEKDDNLQYSVLSPSYAAFAAIRAETSKTNKRKLFNEIADSVEGLSKATNADQVDELMDEWEAANPDKLELSFRRGFFGAPNVANGKLRKKTSVHLVPAVADVSEQTGDPKKSPIIQLLTEIARQIYDNKKEVQEFLKQTTDAFEDLVSPDKIPELDEISGRLTNTIQKYYSNSKLMAEWQVADGVRFQFPQPSIRVEDNGFLTGLENVGHGLQRAALFAIIQFLAENNRGMDDTGEFDTAQSDIILLIEEPEIYQHPQKQQMVANAFHQICATFSISTGIRFQIVFTTHSEKFISIEKFDAVRVLRRKTAPHEVTHQALAVSVDTCRKYFANLLDVAPMTEEAFVAKMHIFSREMCEGFFADKVILGRVDEVTRVEF